MRRTIAILFTACGMLLQAAESDLEKAVELRRTERLSEAAQLLKTYSSPAGFDMLSSPEKIEFLRGLLELAHIRALQDDVPGALSLLNWAEGRKDPYQRAIACVKYAEILLDLGEFERASGYLKNADELIEQRATVEDSGAAVGQGGALVDTGAAWRDLSDDADVLKAEIESETLKKKFGASYGNYVKLRRLQVLLKRSRTPRYLKEAMELADELMETDPASQFAAAAGYLKGEIMTSRLKEESPKKEIKEVKGYLEKFIKQQPDGLYRGEALMLLGKISLEIEWDAKDAEKYYSQALDWFRKARERRDALSLYAPVNDDLKTQILPTQRPTTLNQWKRIVYHDEDPLKLYNTANAPVWYMDDKEKDCLLNLGLLYFVKKKFTEADKCWQRASELDDNIMALTSAGMPNMLNRLQVSCRQKFLITDEADQDGITASEKLKITLIEMYFLTEHFDKSMLLWHALHTRSNVTSAAKAIALMGEADCIRMKDSAAHIQARKYYQLVMQDKEMAKTSATSRALYNLAWVTLQQGHTMRETATKMFEDCIAKNPKSKYAEASLFYLALIHAGYDRKRSEKYANEYFRRYPRGRYFSQLKLRLLEIHQKGDNIKEE